MFNLFEKLTSGNTQVRSLPVEISNTTDGFISRIAERNPLWVRLEGGERNTSMTVREQLTLERMHSIGRAREISSDRVVYSVGKLTAYYYSRPWKSYGLKKEDLPFKIDQTGSGRVTLMSEYSEPYGLPGVLSKSRRMIPFNLERAIMYSYIRDIRFVLVVCAMIGVTAWWALSPEPVLLKPEVLAAEDIEVINGFVRDTFVNKVCCTHQVSSPCECGEPINSQARELFDESLFDPLNINETRGEQLKKGAAVLIACIVISLAIAESVSQYGVLV